MFLLPSLSPQDTPPAVVAGGAFASRGDSEGEVRCKAWWMGEAEREGGGWKQPRPNDVGATCNRGA